MSARTVRIRRLDPSVELPRYQTAGSAAFDLAASAVTTIAPGEVRLVPTGLVIEVPPGMFLGVHSIAVDSKGNAEGYPSEFHDAWSEQP